MTERLRPEDFFREGQGAMRDWTSPPEAAEGTTPIKLYDDLFRFRGYYDEAPEGLCRVRLFHRGPETPVLVISEHPANPTTSVTNLMETLAAEVIAKLCPERFEFEEPVMLVEHYPEERNSHGRIVHEETWDRVAFASWSPRTIWLGGKERVSLGEPDWRLMSRHEVAELIGSDEVDGPQDDG